MPGSDFCNTKTQQNEIDIEKRKSDFFFFEFLFFFLFCSSPNQLAHPNQNNGSRISKTTSLPVSRLYTCENMSTLCSKFVCLLRLVQMDLPDLLAVQLDPGAAGDSAR